MNKKKAEMLFMLLKCREPVSLSDLQALSSYESSMRTIRNDINHINDFLRENDLSTLTVHRDGNVEFSGDEQNRQLALHVLLNQMDYYNYRLDSHERARVLTCHMIQADGYVNHKELCSVVYVSRGTLYTDMQRCAKVASAYGLSLSSAPSKGYVMDGSEWDKRRALYKLQKRWSEKDESSYPDYKYILNRLEEQDDFVFTDRGYLEILRYIEISLDRMRRGYMLKEIPQMEGRRNIPLPECKGAAFIWEYLSAKFLLDPTPEEIIALEIHLRVSGRVAFRKKLSFSELQEAMAAFFENVSAQLSVQLQCAPDTHAELGMFLNSLRFGSNEEYAPDPLMQYALETEYPGITKAVQTAEPMLSAWLCRDFTYGERYQLTLFTASVIESSRPIHRIPRVLLVCDGGPGRADHLRAQVTRMFQIEVVGVTAVHAVARFVPDDSLDLIISTVPIGNFTIPTVQVASVLTVFDVEKILGGLFNRMYGAHLFSETLPQS